jgi:uncharacterized protein YlzI (FlbEa/FlbD family)
MDEQMSSNQLKITAMSVPDLVKLLKRAGSRHVSEAAIQKDIDAGAPTNPDGTINLINYTAYLVKEEVHNANN